jgi:precorrin-2 dehydrogenase/sirohydrochlorin ferrochelatase
MLPVTIDPSRVPMALVGRGPAFARRLDWLLDAGAWHALVFTDAPVEEPRAQRLAHLFERLPQDNDLANVRLVWITGLAIAEAEAIAAGAHAADALVNVEDVTSACDFHTPSVVHRGDLLLTISTGGLSPGLAARLRARLAVEFGPEWGERLQQLARKRAAWRRRPRTLEELAVLTDAAIDAKGWLDRELRA